MKNAKKILSLVLSLVLVFSVSAFAGISVGAEAGMEVYTDDFENSVTSKISLGSYFRRFPRRDQGQSSDVFAHYNEDSINEDCAEGSLVSDIELFRIMEEGDNKVLEMDHKKDDGTTYSGNLVVKTKSLTYSEGQIVNFSYDIKFNSFATKVQQNGADLRYFCMLREDVGGFSLLETAEGAEGSPNKLQKYNDASTEGFCPEVGKWYRAVAQVGTDGSLTTILLDTATDEVVLSNTISGAYADGDKVQFTAVKLLGLKKAESEGRTTVWLDNAELVTYNPAEVAPNVSKASVESETTDIRRNTELSFSFDQPVSGDLILKKGNETVEGVTTSSNTMRDKLTLNYSGILDRKTTYTVSFSALTNDGGLPCGYEDVTFTTEDLHIWNDVLIDTPSADGTKTAITFILEEEYGYEVVSGGMMAMLYRDNKLIGVDMVVLENQDITSAITKSFSLGGQPQAGDTVRLMLVDTAESLVPFAVGSLIIE